MCDIVGIAEGKAVALMMVKGQQSCLEGGLTMNGTINNLSITLAKMRLIAEGALSLFVAYLRHTTRCA